MRVLVACEYSGVVRDAFLARGHAAMSCDILPTESPGPHYQGDVRDCLIPGWDLIIAHPPCTFLTNAGSRHLHDSVTSVNGVRAAISGQARRLAMLSAKEFFMLFYNTDVAPRVAIENPVPHFHANLPRYTQLIQPWQFGHDEKKGTCLWLRGLPELRLTSIRTVRHARVHMQPPSADRSKIRSKFFTGIAAAMAEQWGGKTLT